MNQTQAYAEYPDELSIWVDANADVLTPEQIAELDRLAQAASDLGVETVNYGLG